MSAAGVADAAGLPERANLPDTADLPAPAELSERATPPDPTGLADPAGLTELPAEADLAQAVLETIREASAQPRLIALEEILERLRERGLAEGLETPPPADARPELAAIVADLPEIASFASRSGRTLYHDPTLLSRAYARLLDNQDAVDVLLAGEIRASSRDCPRPVPRQLFERPPFNLSLETIEAALDAMAADPAFADIASTTTSLGTVYLYSGLYLDRGHAAFLAEQDDAMAMNP